jgi:hypothetical protein
VGPVVTLVEDGASNPTVAVGADGAAYVAWIADSDVWLARSADGEAYEPAVRVNDVAGDAAAHAQAPAQVAAAPNGDVYVVWQNNRIVQGRRFPASDLRFARSTDGGRSFEPAIHVNDDAGGPPSSHTFHDIAVSVDGTVYVSWIDGRVRAAAESAAAVPPVDAADHEGHGAMHDASLLPGSEVRIAVSTDGGRSFGASRVVMQPVCPCCRTSLALGDSGQVFVGFRSEGERDLRDIVVARSGDGGLTFAEPARVHADDWRIEGCPHAGPSLVLDDAGRLHAAWYTGIEARQGLHYAVSEDGGRSFGAPSPLLTGGWVPVTQVKMAAAPGGRVYLAWTDPREPVGRLHLGVTDGGNAPEAVPMDALPATAPSIAAGAGGAVVAWQDGGAVRALWLAGRR